MHNGVHIFVQHKISRFYRPADADNGPHVEEGCAVVVVVAGNIEVGVVGSVTPASEMMTSLRIARKPCIFCSRRCARKPRAAGCRRTASNS